MHHGYWQMFSSTGESMWFQTLHTKFLFLVLVLLFTKLFLKVNKNQRKIELIENY